MESAKLITVMKNTTDTNEVVPLSFSSPPILNNQSGDGQSESLDSPPPNPTRRLGMPFPCNGFWKKTDPNTGELDTF